jgi:hypothetical protein
VRQLDAPGQFGAIGQDACDGRTNRPEPEEDNFQRTTGSGSGACGRIEGHFRGHIARPL